MRLPGGSQRPFTAPVDNVLNFSLPLSINNLRKNSRETKWTEASISPLKLAELRLQHNSILRAWSYKGTTMIPASASPHCALKARLTKISRSSRVARSLPPLFHKIPDMRKRPTNVKNDSVQEMRKLVTTFTPRRPDFSLRSGDEAGSTFEVMKLLGDKLKGIKNSFTRSSTVAVPHELNVDTGIAFCQEIVRASDGLDGLEKTFDIIDADHNGDISLEELKNFLGASGMKPEEIKGVHRYLEGNSRDRSEKNTVRFATMTRELIQEYERSKEMFFFKPPSDFDTINQADKYFKRQTLCHSLIPPRTAPV
jgi:Ca2+-binding EF-hand superfamily protein